jgi:hypothetical protein
MTNLNVTNHWEEELKKASLKEPPFKSKLKWLNPITAFSKAEFRGNRLPYFRT